MKNLSIKMIIAFAFISFSANAQKDSSGVYLNAFDFTNKKLSYVINCKTEKHKIKLNSFFAQDYITVIHQGVKYKLSKDSVFGFKTCDGKSYRIINKSDFVILNPDDDLLLFKFQPLSSAKNPVPASLKFSFKANGPVLDLNRTNLKNILPDNHSFHDELENMFSNDNSLLDYDSYHNQYKVVRLFNKYK